MPEAAGAFVSRINAAQRAAGLEGVLVDPYTAGGATVTVTGWAALACIVSFIVVVIWGAALAYRRVSGIDRPHTQYVRDGDL
jgi:hypothetical protein